MGERIRKRRESLNIPMNDLAKAVGVTASLISQIERAKAFPSILTLKKIAEALDTSVGLLIGEQATFMETPVLAMGERRFAKKNNSGTSLYILSHHDPQKMMDPFLLEFKAKGNSKGIMTPKNPNQEFCFVLKGSFKVQLGKSSFFLNQGDSFYFISNQEHLFENTSNDNAQLLWVVNLTSL